jgi:hypothetical protein
MGCSASDAGESLLPSRVGGSVSSPHLAPRRSGAGRSVFAPKALQLEKEMLSEMKKREKEEGAHGKKRAALKSVMSPIAKQLSMSLAPRKMSMAVTPNMAPADERSQRSTRSERSSGRAEGDGEDAAVSAQSSAVGAEGDAARSGRGAKMAEMVAGTANSVRTAGSVGEEHAELSVQKTMEAVNNEKHREMVQHFKLRSLSVNQALEVGSKDQLDLVEGEMLKRSGLVKHESGLVKSWEVLTMVLVVFQIIYIPYVIGFSPPPDPPLEAVQLFTDIIFIVDVFAQFNISNKDSNGRYVVRRRDVCKQYLFGWFVVDFVAALPFDKITTNKGGVSGRKGANASAEAGE